MPDKELSESVSDLKNDIKDFLEKRIKQFYAEQYVPITELRIYFYDVADMWPNIVGVEINFGRMEGGTWKE